MVRTFVYVLDVQAWATWPVALLSLLAPLAQLFKLLEMLPHAGNDI